jgi:hypothetical protein
MTTYTICHTCGRFVAAGSVINRAYCSEECTRSYAECANCGRFFPRGKGFDGTYCTQACTVRYQILRKYGPEPVTVVTEA